MSTTHNTTSAQPAPLAAVNNLFQPLIRAAYLDCRVAASSLEAARQMVPLILGVLAEQKRKGSAEVIAKRQKMEAEMRACIEALSGMCTVFQHDNKEDFLKALLAWNPPNLVGASATDSEMNSETNQVEAD